MKEKLKHAAGKAYRFSNSWTGTIVIVLFVIFFVAQAFRIPSGSMKDSLLIGDHLFAKKFAYGISTPHLPFLEIPLIPGTDGHIVDGDEPQRGDIVIFRFPKNTKLHYVKRCVAVPGDELFLRNKDLYLHPHEGDDYIRKHYPKEKIISEHGKLWVRRPYQDEHPGIHHDPRINVSEDTPIIIDKTNGHMQYLPRDSYEFDQLRNNRIQLRSEYELLEHNPIFAMPVTKVPERSYFMMGDNRDHSNDSRFWGPVPYGLVEGTPWFVYFSMDDNYEIRWDRMFKTPEELEQPPYLDRAIAEREREEGVDRGLY